MKKILFAALSSFTIFVLSSLGISFAEENVSQSTPKITSEQNSLEEQLNSKQPDSKLSEANKEPIFEIPEWVRRTNFAVSAGSDQKPQYFLETIQPLLGSQFKDIVIFNQTRITSQDERPKYNIGFGLRKIFWESLLLGVNSFYDYQDLHKHSRGGVGFEAITDKGLEARINTYIRISNERLVNEDASNEYYEKVANGLDWELGLPVPYIPSVKVYGGGSWYDFDHFKNKMGWKFRTEFTPAKYSRFALIISDDNKNSGGVNFGFEGAITFAFTSFSPRDIINDIRSAKAAYPKVNLDDKVLDRVVRDFDITVITSTKSKATGLTVEGGKK